MSPILGIWASKYTLPTNYYSIATATVTSGGTASITFSSIPQTYTHLQLRAITRSDRAVNFITYGYMQFNGVTGAGNYYAAHQLSGDGTSATASVDSSSTYTGDMAVAGGTSLANTFGVNIIDILDYTNTNKNKTVRILEGGDQNNSGSQYVSLISGLWLSTSAINSITLTAYNGNWAQYTSFALYGIK